MFTYLTEYEDHDGNVHLADFHDDINAARSKARRLTRKDHSLLVYVVACDHEDARMGAECYVCGRRDHIDGQITP